LRNYSGNRFITTWKQEEIEKDRIQGSKRIEGRKLKKREGDEEEGKGEVRMEKKE